jgi:uncharacterized protein (DUF1015 family)
VAQYDFVTDDNIGNTLWLVSDPKDIDIIQQAFANMEYLYVADGHHRTASAAKVGLVSQRAIPGLHRRRRIQLFMTVIFRIISSRYLITTA